MEGITDRLVDFATGYGLQVIGAILILIIGRIVASGVRRLLRKGLTARGTDPAIVGFTSGIAYYLVLVFSVIAILSNFGIETASLVAVLGAAGFAIGFALQGSLSNFAAGIMLLVFRPYRIGDYVDIAGTAGTVKEMAIFTTTLMTPDNVKIMVPNGKIFGDTIKNVTAEDTRRVDMVVGIGYGSSIEKAVGAIQSVLQADERVLKEPAPQIAVAELADSSVNLVVRPWVKTSDYWGVKFDVTRRIKETLDQQDIEIPFPQVTVHQVKS
ncbi:MAG: mechanosensitive ion channel [Candidatus Eisenbacteria sp.]|nr:mechanosensitive ion channel [Candidatus Eisenbacteria bacterium]